MPAARQLYELKPVEATPVPRLPLALKVVIGALIVLALILLGRGSDGGQDPQPSQQHTSTSQTGR